VLVAPPFGTTERRMLPPPNPQLNRHRPAVIELALLAMFMLGRNEEEEGMENK
jgi:hypothetical protein